MRSKALGFLLISCFFVKFAQSQPDELIVQGQTGKLYLLHTVIAKENWYSVGRLYNISPKEVATFDNLNMAKPLSIGQQLQIPLTAANFSQTGIKVPAETLVPVYHVVQEKEWMYRVSVNYNKVAIPSLEKWNNINKDQVRSGMHLIVGYLKVKTALSALASGAGAGRSTAAAGQGGGAPAGVTGSVPAGGSNNGVPAGISSGGTSPGAPVAVEKPVIPPASGSAGKPATTNATPTGISGGGTTNPAGSAPAVVEKPVSSPTSVVNATTVINFKGGYFKTDYTESGKTVGGTGGTFKSSSGWQDGKYYALMNNVAVGTIVKISLSGSGKTIYAKVLGQLPDMKESVGLTIRISNAAASELGQGEGRFGVDVKY